MPANTPIAVVQNASTLNECSVIGQLHALHTLIESSGMASPAVILVGDVLNTLASLRHEALNPDKAFAIALPGA
jgi:uroporphyrin-III C-methyltransferase